MEIQHFIVNQIKTFWMPDSKLYIIAEKFKFLLSLFPCLMVISTSADFTEKW